MNYVAIFWGSSRGDLISKLVFCCCKHVIIFQGMKAWVTMQLNKKHAPFVIGIHCMAHTCNLAMQSFLNLSFVVKIKSMYIYSPCIYIFSHSFRWGTLSMQSWQKKLKQGGKIFHNVKIWKSWCLHLPNMFYSTIRLLGSRSRWVITC